MYIASLIINEGNVVEQRIGKLKKAPSLPTRWQEV